MDPTSYASASNTATPTGQTEQLLPADGGSVRTALPGRATLGASQGDRYIADYLTEEVLDRQPERY